MLHLIVKLKTSYIALLALILISCTVTADDSMVLAEKGKAKAVIVTPDGKLTSSEYIAAHDLAKYLGKIANAEFKIVTDSKKPSDTAYIYVGRIATDKLGIDPHKLAGDEWMVKTDDNNLYITGGLWQGVERGAFHFLEDVLGVHWWTPWDESVPSMDTIKISKLDMHGKPEFPLSRRHDGNKFERFTFNSRNGGTRDIFVDEEGNFSWADSSGGIGHGHTLLHPRLVPPKKYLKTNPDFFAKDSNGKIALAGGKMVGYCFNSNSLEELLLKKIEICIEERIQRANAGKHQHFVPFDYHVSIGDHSPACLCPKCRTIYKKENSHAASSIIMLNRLGKDIQKKYPWAIISTLAYESTRNAPKNVSANETLMVRYCTEPMNIAAPIEDPSNKKVRDEFLAWKEKSKLLGLWIYESDFAPHRGMGGYGITWDLPIPNLYLLSGRYKYWRDNGVVSVFQQSLGEDNIQPDMRPIKLWVTLKLMENPDRDINKLVMTFTNGFYGPAGKYVRQYLNLLHQAGMKNKSIIPFYGGMGSYKYLNVNFIIRANHIFDKAQATVADDPILSRRVRRTRIGIDRSIILLWPKLIGEWVKQGHPARDIPLNREVALKRYEQTYHEQIDKRKLPKDQWPYKSFGQDVKQISSIEIPRLKKTLDAVKNNVYIPAKVPAQFKNMNIFDYPVGGAQFKFKESEFVKMVDDKDAAGGKAIKITGKALKLPVMNSTGIIKPEQITKPGYNWYRLGIANFGRSSCIDLFKPSGIKAYTFEYGPHEVWVSLKFDGPAFKFGNKNVPNTAWLERMILVSPSNFKIKGNLSLPGNWTIFAPMNREDPLPANAQLSKIPEKLKIADKTFTPIVRKINDGALDLAPLIGGSVPGRTAYVFIPFTTKKTQTVTLGFGADWWLQVWLNGKEILNTLDVGGCWPITPWNHIVTTDIPAGKHVLAIRFLSGGGSSMLKISGPTRLREQLMQNTGMRHGIWDAPAEK